MITANINPTPTSTITTFLVDAPVKPRDRQQIAYDLFKNFPKHCADEDYKGQVRNVVVDFRKLRLLEEEQRLDNLEPEPKEEVEGNDDSTHQPEKERDIYRPGSPPQVPEVPNMATMEGLAEQHEVDKINEVIQILEKVEARILKSKDSNDKSEVIQSAKKKRKKSKSKGNPNPEVVIRPAEPVKKAEGYPEFIKPAEPFMKTSTGYPPEVIKLAGPVSKKSKVSTSEIPESIQPIGNGKSIIVAVDATPTRVGGLLRLPGEEKLIFYYSVEWDTYLDVSGDSVQCEMMNAGLALEVFEPYLKGFLHRYEGLIVKTDSHFFHSAKGFNKNPADLQFLSMVNRKVKTYRGEFVHALKSQKDKDIINADYLSRHAVGLALAVTYDDDQEEIGTCSEVKVCPYTLVNLSETAQNHTLKVLVSKVPTKYLKNEVI